MRSLLKKARWLAALASLTLASVQAPFALSYAATRPQAHGKSCPASYAAVPRQKSLDRELARVLKLIARRKAATAYPAVPSVEKLPLPKTRPAPVTTPSELSAGLADPLLEQARKINAFEDFKPLSDVRPRALTSAEKKAAELQAQRIAQGEGKPGSLAYRRAYLRNYIERTYDFGSELQAVPGMEHPRWELRSGDSALDHTFSYVEKMWGSLLRKTEPQEGGSLLGTPFPMLVPGGRFQETYYWDTYFGIKGLLATDRLELAEMQTENLLELIRHYGFVPNGTRDYYLTRGQVPFSSSAVREVFTAAMEKAKTRKEKDLLRRWLRERAFPLVRGEYRDFWMNPATRYDPKTGLNHHWDDANLPRPERHGHDDEESIAKTYRDVRCAAESGLDFTDAHAGEACRVAPVLLNSMLFKTETDLAWMAKEVGLEKESQRLSQAAKKRAIAMRQYLWNEKEGRFENYHLREKRRIDALTADTFVPLFVGMASKKEADRIRAISLPRLERDSGIAASTLHSIHQWDGDNLWAPQQVMSVAGLRNYETGPGSDSVRIAKKWTSAIARLHEKEGAIFERIDASGAKPARDEKKYPTQEGFLWTNGGFAWMLEDILKEPKAALPAVK